MEPSCYERQESNEALRALNKAADAAYAFGVRSIRLTVELGQLPDGSFAPDYTGDEMLLILAERTVKMLRESVQEKRAMIDDAAQDARLRRQEERRAAV